MHTLVLILAVFGLSRIGTCENGTFVATNEWQEIQDGQQIPAGLHIRINLQTGKKEVKLLDENEQSEDDAALATLPKATTTTENYTPAQQTKNKHLLEQQKQHTSSSADTPASSNGSETPAEEPKTKTKTKVTLTEALKHLRQNQLTLDYTEEKLRQIKRDYKELKDSVDEMKKSFKSDAEIILLLMQDFKNVSKVEAQEDTPAAKTKTTQLLQVLENLNYLVHQIDNALWFIDNGGLDNVLLPMIVNQTNIALRIHSLRVLGALTQNNPKAQIKVFEKNLDSYLAQILITSTNTEELSAALYAFGSILRKFPIAQQRLLSKLGTKALITVLAKECELKLKAKAITIINDVVAEKAAILSETVDEDDSDPLYAAQFVEPNLALWLEANDYCETIQTVMTTKLNELLEQPDLAEYFIDALRNTKSLCYQYWSRSSQLRHALFTMIERYTRSGQEYSLEVGENIEKLTKELYNNMSSKYKNDEL